MSSPQKISFRSIEDFLSFLPMDERRLVDRLRTIISDCFPNPVERLRYNVPFYYRCSRVCYIWPSSVPWGNVRSKGVSLGFCQGYLLSDEFHYLEKNKRKQVLTKTYMDIMDVDQDLIKAFVYEAIEVDDMLWRQRQK